MRNRVIKCLTPSIQNSNWLLQIANDVNERLNYLLFPPMKHVKKKVSNESAALLEFGNLCYQQRRKDTLDKHKSHNNSDVYSKVRDRAKGDIT